MGHAVYSVTYHCCISLWICAGVEGLFDHCRNHFLDCGSFLHRDVADGVHDLYYQIKTKKIEGVDAR